MVHQSWKASRTIAIFGLVFLSWNVHTLASQRAFLELETGFDAHALAADLGLPTLPLAAEANWALVELPPSLDEASLLSLAQEARLPIVAVYEDIAVHADQRPQEFIDKMPLDGGFWHQPARDQVKGGLIGREWPPPASGPRVAILDTGLDDQHPLIRGSASNLGHDFVDGDHDPQERRDHLDNDADGFIDEDHGHGTHVAGLVLLLDPSTELVAYRVLDADGIGRVSDVVRALDRAISAEVRIVQMSFSTDIDSKPLRDAVQRAVDAGIILIASTGNHGDTTPRFPAAYEGVVAVAAVDHEDVLLLDSSYGSHVDILSPGLDTISAYPGGGLVRRTGTSFAAPIIAGAAARLLKWADGEEAAILPALFEGANDVSERNPGREGQIGHGRLDLVVSRRGL